MYDFLKRPVKIFILLSILVFFLPRVEAEEKVFEVSEVDKKPSLILKKTPVYPRVAKIKGMTGKVLLRFQIGSDGTVSNIEVVDSEPEGVFDEAAIDAVSKWRFKPAFIGEERVATRVKIPIKFNL